jgi:hypothetical protein
MEKRDIFCRGKEPRFLGSPVLILVALKLSYIGMCNSASAIVIRIPVLFLYRQCLKELSPGYFTLRYLSISFETENNSADVGV